MNKNVAKELVDLKILTYDDANTKYNEDGTINNYTGTVAEDEYGMLHKISNEYTTEDLQILLLAKNTKMLTSINKICSTVMAIIIINAILYLIMLFAQFR